ncbi:MAG TPA: GTPase Era [Chitinophagales bacterium]|nr:GTPase Era [Chitinophagales bacterium]
MHHSGFVSIIGRPNVGKSTLLNALLGEKLSIVTPKAQTTRHRIIGILNGDNYQIVFSDTPGIIFEPKHKLHKAMMRSVMESLEDADVLLFITDIFEKKSDVSTFLDELQKLKAPKILVINKIDLLKSGTLESLTTAWQKQNLFNEIIPVSALQIINMDKLSGLLLNYLPEHPPYYPKDELTDRNLRYFVSEIIREKLFLHYKQEIPYSCEVVVADYKEAPDINRIRAEIIVERESQKAIIIGKKGSALKKIGIESRADIEKLAGKKVYLELFVKVRENWRNDERLLKSLGYL